MPKFVIDELVEQEISQRYEHLKGEWEYSLERTLLDITEQIAKTMENSGLSKAELARQLGVSRSYITQVLNGKPNLNLSTLFKIAFAIGLIPSVRMTPKSLIQPTEFRPAYSARWVVVQSQQNTIRRIRRIPDETNFETTHFG